MHRITLQRKLPKIQKKSPSRHSSRREGFICAEKRRSGETAANEAKLVLRIAVTAVTRRPRRQQLRSPRRGPPPLAPGTQTSTSHGSCGLHYVHPPSKVSILTRPTCPPLPIMPLWGTHSKLILSRMSVKDAATRVLILRKSLPAGCLLQEGGLAAHQSLTASWPQGVPLSSPWPPILPDCFSY